MTQQQAANSAHDDRVIVGIDWADQEHAVCVIDPKRGRPRHDTLAQHPDEISRWFADLRARYPDRKLCVILETSEGPLFHSLIAVAHVTLFPVNPKQLARFREALYPTGKKDDATDAELLARLLLQHPDQLRECRPDDERTRRLARLSELRRTLVEQQKAAVQQLAAALKLYFPLFIRLFPGKLQKPLPLALLKRWPTLKRLQRAAPATLRKVLAEHGVCNPSRQADLISQFRAEPDLINDPALIEPQASYVTHLARSLTELDRTIRQFDDDIATATNEHPDAPLFRALPGAGAALVPRLIAAFGSDRERFQSPAEVQNRSGISPIAVQSGNTRKVRRRRACPKFLRQTFHEFADHARKWSRWSRAWYEHKRATGMKHSAAVRALAYKWIRIIFRLWKQHEIYSEERYINALIRTHSPIAEKLKNQPANT